MYIIKGDERVNKILIAEDEAVETPLQIAKGEASSPLS